MPTGQLVQTLCSLRSVHLRVRVDGVISLFHEEEWATCQMDKRKGPERIHVFFFLCGPLSLLKLAADSFINHDIKTANAPQCSGRG